MYEVAYSIIRIKHALEEIVTNYFDKITNSNIKKILKRHNFYDKVNTLAKLLQLIKNAILLFERNNTNLADVFIQMIRLVYIIKNFRSNNLVALKQHAI
ncbi:hypothetical protein GLOIN_2v1481073 [Rhizophagus clarus]|uniref:Uncharacterized protein n=1 Tax=Rhizophagus clarus TaxID=94130 RepID=A0A8H3QYA0_9GLOM|nr:hypothetical protein GLOIN_2v1481073 [Rhizophagus clarus]